MTWCAKCGVSGDKEPLFVAISNKGLVRVCKKCVLSEGWPIIKKPEEKKPIIQQPLPKDLRNQQVKMGRDSRQMFDRLTRLSGVILPEKKPEDPKLIKQNKELKELANRNYESKLVVEKGDSSELIENFNWAIMRARRARHITPEELARAIGESDVAVKRAEQGALPANNAILIRKIEDYLKIRLFKTAQKTAPQLRFDSYGAKNVTLGELKNVKKDNVGFGIATNTTPGEMPAGKIENKIEEKELSDEEIDDIFFK